jgi:hypothetical protein
MYTYVWGILIAAFILDISRKGLGETEKPIDEATDIHNEPIVSEGIKIYTEDNREVPVAYDSKFIHNSKLNIKVQYCTS